MSEVTPQWVDPDCVFQTRGLNTTAVPVLTLDGLEAWLKDMRSPLCNFRPTPQANRIAIGVYGDLLAQVQAWKATHTRSER